MSRPTNISRRRASRGFTMIVALMVLALVATTVTAIAVLLAQQAARTATVQAEAQAQQLLLAGLLIAPSMLDAPAPPNTPRPDSYPVPMPPSLADRNATLNLRFATDGATRQVEITARCGRAVRVETATFTRSNNHWTSQD